MQAKDFLLELGLEELPPKAMPVLMQSLRQLMEAALQTAELSYREIEVLGAPRRLSLVIRGLAEKQQDREVERRGPAKQAAFDAEGKPTKALLGFAKSCQAEVDDLQLLETDKGAWMMFRAKEAGRSAEAILPELILQSLQQLPIAKRMRWGASRDEFIRPLHWLVALLGDDVLPLEIFGITSGRETRGHRAHSPGVLTIESIARYRDQLREAKVIVDFDERKASIRQQIHQVVGQVFPAAEANGIHAVIDEDLLTEVTALTDWPVAMIGRFEERFLEVPAECLISTMKENQKYFHIVGADKSMLAAFVFIANLDSKDPEKVVAGNERVVRPRLSDAAFFYETDRKQTLESRLPKLESILFQKSLGTVLEKSKRLEKLAAAVAERIGADTTMAARAGLLSKADLVSDMVLEFPELQGTMGRYYAIHDGEPAVVAEAIEAHYWPRFAGDRVPQTTVAASVALADRLDTLTGIFGIGQAPTGTKDPFALRRAALGVLRISIEHHLEMDLSEIIGAAMSGYSDTASFEPGLHQVVFDYVFDRFRNLYEEQGVSSAAFLAVRKRPVRSPYEFHQRILAVESFRTMPEAEALIAANKRVSNILAKSNLPEDANQQGSIDEGLLQSDEERALFDRVVRSEETTHPLLNSGKFAEALSQLAQLKSVTDDFFDKVMVMTDDAALRENRLNLLKRLRALFLNIADIAELSS
ncbi:MAG: glycine--tRNA ligase subunit beta [unclassified Hahellaceae]|nr:glycine--tRNA ligase subunit beta [Hahellaceae bacterium]|tara:strand:+ start:20209 stop:22314 length:2106 start_codon:yes stop_codon:yes gene_type:complete